MYGCPLYSFLHFVFDTIDIESCLIYFWGPIVPELTLNRVKK